MDAPAQPLVFHRAVPGGITRRRALGWMAASAALASAGCTPASRERIHPWVRMPEARGADDPLYYATAILREGHAQGVLVGAQHGRPIKVEGNPLHPSSLGATDPLAQGSVLDLWDPDRSPMVMQRLADAGQAAPAGWEAFEAAWRGIAARANAKRGEGLRVLTGPITSPTLRAQLTRWLAALPGARWHQYAALQDAAAQAGALTAFGRPVQLLPQVARARCIVALGADPFSDGPGSVRHAADWASARAAGRGPSLLAAEVAPGLFGARADRRIALAPWEMDAVVQRIAMPAGTNDTQTVLTPAAESFAADLLSALHASGPDTLVFAGSCLSPASHAALHGLHQRLGAMGRTLQLLPPLAFAPQAGTLAQLVTAMRAGAVETLVILDANPVYDAPGALGFAQALAKVPTTVHAGLYRDETARDCGWHLPLSHAYEQWSDARAHDGTATLLQPSIEPLYATRSLHEVVALLAGDTLRDGWRILQAHWQAEWAGDFAARWRDSLRRGVVADSATTPLAVTARGNAPAEAVPARAAGSLTAVFAPDPSTLDGRHANNAWLQELPRPFSKFTWDNAVLLGPRTAQAAGIATGDRVRVHGAAGSVEGPAWVDQLHAEGAVTLPLGYGRRAAGRVGNGVGFDAYRVRPAAGDPTVVRLERMRGERHAFALVQNNQDPVGREPARAVPRGAAVTAAREPMPSLYPEDRSPEHAWAMVIDLDACIGCNACTIACQAENNIPVVGKHEVARGHEMHWIRVDRYASELPGGSIFQPVPCMHCEKAPCELVCPVGATMHDSEGLNVQVYNRCIGTRFCSNNCPYKVRRFNFLQYSDTETPSLQGQRNPEVTVRQRGVMEKCTYCLQRIARARQHAQATGVPLADGDVVTACQAVCPTRAIHFGDLRNPAGEVQRLRRSPRHYVLLEELDTQPRTTYLARVGESRKP